MTNNYLIIDYGNSFIKAAIYDTAHDKIIEERKIKKTTNPKLLLSQFTSLKKHKITKVIEVATSVAQYVKPFNCQLKKLLKADIKVVNRNDFEDLLDLSNLKPNLLIGGDILVAAYYISKKLKSGAAFSFGTAYFAIVVKQKQLRSAYLLPSMVRALRTISQTTAIPNDYLPKVFDKNQGLDTHDAFSAGVNVSMDGFVSNVLTINKLPPRKAIICGGDCLCFKNINKKYKVIPNLILLGLIEVIKAKGW